MTQQLSNCMPFSVEQSHGRIPRLRFFSSSFGHMWQWAQSCRDQKTQEGAWSPLPFASVTHSAVNIRNIHSSLSPEFVFGKLVHLKIGVPILCFSCFTHTKAYTVTSPSCKQWSFLCWLFKEGEHSRISQIITSIWSYLSTALCR